MIAHVEPSENNIVSNFSGEKEDVFNTIYSEYSILKLKNSINKHTKNYYFLDGDINSLKESIALIESYGDTDSDDFLYVKDCNSLMANFLQANPRNDKQLKVRIVNNDKFALYQYFYEHAELIAKVFKKETVLIIGNNYRALELMKMILWLQQSADTSLSISCFYEDDKDKARLLSAMPAVFNEDGYEKSYTLNLLKGDSDDYSRVDELIRVHHIRTVFAVSDDTFSNLHLSDYININSQETVDIFTAIDSEFVLKTLEPNKKYNVISFFSEDYIVNNLISANSHLENQALAFHRTYQDQFVEKTFYNNPYNYYSSMARALGNSYLNRELSQEDQQRAEHNRWSMYLKTEGWTYASERDNANKKNPLLIPYDQLPEAEKIKDIN